MVSLRGTSVNRVLDNFNVDFGKRLREERERRGLNQSAFGALGGVAKIAQLNYEKGYRVPDGKYLHNLYEHGVDVAYLLSGRQRGNRGDSEHVDTKILASAMKAVYDVQRTEAVALSEDDRALFIASLYDLLATGGAAGEAPRQVATIMLKGWFVGRTGGV